MSIIFNWIPFQEELADKLLLYKNKRAELFQIMKDLSTQNPLLTYLHFENEEWWGSRNYEIDPFSIFATFNRQIKPTNKIEIAKLIANKLDVITPVPDDFTGIPIMNNQHAFFGGNDEIWELFETSITCAKTGNFDKNFEVAFENAIKASGNGLATITMGLFWIRPNTFLNLDSQNKDFLENPKNGLNSVLANLPKSLKKYIPNGNEYIFMCKEINRLLNTHEFEFENLPEMSHSAWMSDDLDDVKRLANIVCLYYARLHSNDTEYKENCTKTFETISQLTGIKHNTLRQNKDSFDPLFENGRKGYYQKPLENKNKALFELYTKYKDMPISELKAIVDSLLQEIYSHLKIWVALLHLVRLENELLKMKIWHQILLMKLEVKTVLINSITK